MYKQSDQDMYSLRQEFSKVFHENKLAEFTNGSS